jgi:hypothetical protein
MPLVVEQAGALLADTGMSADTYLSLLANRAEEVWHLESGGVYPASVATSWAVAFDRLAADDALVRPDGDSICDTPAR